jgi:hypothetical protein
MEFPINSTLSLGSENRISVGDGRINVEEIAAGVYVAVKEFKVGGTNGEEVKVGSVVIGFTLQETKDRNSANAQWVRIELRLHFMATSFFF